MYQAQYQKTAKNYEITRDTVMWVKMLCQISAKENAESYICFTFSALNNVKHVETEKSIQNKV